jgi:futalosine hydrolase
MVVLFLARSCEDTHIFAQPLGVGIISLNFLGSCGMKLLLVAATPMETAILRESLSMQEQEQGWWEQAGAEICLLHTGLGMVNTAYHLGRFLAKHEVSQAINFGIAGAWDRALALGEVVEVVADCFAEMGADSPEGYLNLEAMGFPLWQTEEAKVFNELFNPQPSSLALSKVSALTVNRVSGTEANIARRFREWPAQIETMEGAAFFHACLLAKVPFRAFRSISNYVEPRNRENWELKKALEAIQHFLFAFVQDLN